jgi:hypothetical protein
MDVVTRCQPVAWDDLDFGAPVLSYVLGEVRLSMKVRYGSGAHRMALFVVLVPGLDDVGNLPCTYADPVTLGVSCFYHAPLMVIRPDLSSLVDMTYKPEGGELYVDAISQNLFVRHDKRIQPLDLRTGILRSRTADTSDAVIFRRWRVLESAQHETSELFKFPVPVRISS